VVVAVVGTNKRRHNLCTLVGTPVVMEVDNNLMVAAKPREDMEAVNLLEDTEEDNLQVLMVVDKPQVAAEVVALARPDPQAHLDNPAAQDNPETMAHPVVPANQVPLLSHLAHNPRLANRAATQDPQAHLDLPVVQDSQATPDNPDRARMEVDKVLPDPLAHPDLPAVPANQAAQANLAHPERSFKVVEDKAHPALLDPLASPVNQANPDKALNPNPDHQARPETWEHPANLAHPEIPEPLATMASREAAECATTAHHREPHRAIKNLSFLAFFVSTALIAHATDF